MNHQETVKLLALMSAMDRRTIGDAEVMAWQSVLDDTEFADAAEAVRRHYRESDSYLMPVHVRRGAATIAEAREAAARHTGWAPGQYGVSRTHPLPEVTGRIAEGDVAVSVKELLAGLRAMLPEGSREALMPRTVHWERHQHAFQRTDRAEPNPHYNPATTAARQACRENGPHDDGVHSQGCPDAELLPCHYCNDYFTDRAKHEREAHPNA